MKEENKNEELQSRRQFFKSAAKATLPVLGVVVFSQLPIKSFASTGCNTGCQGGCRTLCEEGCSHSCNGNCKDTCSGHCNTTCKGTSTQYWGK